MKAITILQPWASLIACGAKKIETRSWPTNYRGPIAIHAGKGKKYYGLEHQEPFLTALEDQILISEDIGGPVEAEYEDVRSDLPYSAVIAIAELVDCQEMTMEKIVAWRDIYGKNEVAFGDFEPGRYAWILDNVRPIRPVSARGQQRIWNWDGDLHENH